MNKIVTFPGLGLEINLNPILVSITDSFGIHWYGAIIAVGFLLAVYFCSRQREQFGIKQDDIYDMLIFTVPMAIIGARLYYVAFEFKNMYYVPGNAAETLRRIVRIWDGGLAIYGGLIFALVTAFIFCKVKNIKFGAFADLGSMGFLIGQLVGRWGNFVNVEAFGGLTDVPWRMAGPNVANYLKYTGQIDAAVQEQIVAGTLGVHPTFFYESLWNFIGLLILVLVVKKHRKFDGQMILSYVVWYGIGRFWIEGLRTDSLYIAGSTLRVSQLLALVSALSAAGIMIYVLIRKKPKPEVMYVNIVKAKEAAENGGESA